MYKYNSAVRRIQDSNRHAGLFLTNQCLLTINWCSIYCTIVSQPIIKYFKPKLVCVPKPALFCNFFSLFYRTEICSYRQVDTAAGRPQSMQIRCRRPLCRYGKGAIPGAFTNPTLRDDCSYLCELRSLFIDGNLLYLPL